MEYLVVRLTDDRSVGQWAVFDSDGRIVQRLGAGSGSVTDAARGRRVIALVPGVDVVNTTATLPSSSPARLRKMLPYSLEDLLAEDIEDLFFAVGRRLDSNTVSVAIVAQQRFESWLGALAEHELTPSAVYSDAEGVPDMPSTLTLVIEAGRVFGRMPGQPAFVLEGLTLSEVVESVGAADTIRHAIVYIEDSAQPAYERELRALAAKMSSVDVHLLKGGALYRLGSTIVTRPATNLLQGPYAPKSNWGSLLRPWRLAASLLVGFLLLLLVSQAAQFVVLRQQDRALTVAVSDRCAAEFSAQQLAACETAVRARLGRSGMLEDDGGDFLAALAAIAGSNGQTSRVEALSFRNRVMDLQVIVPDVPALDSLAQEIERTGEFDVAIQSANPGESGVEGRVQLVGANR